MAARRRRLREEGTKAHGRHVMANLLAAWAMGLSESHPQVAPLLPRRQQEEEEEEEEGRERLIKDLERKANSLSRGTRQASVLGLEGSPPPYENCSARYD